MTQRFKPFFVHHNMSAFKAHNASQRQKPKAFTVKVEPGSTPRTVKVAVTFCSQRDEFVKAHGRQYVEQATFTEINTRHLPGWLSTQANLVLNPYPTVSGDFDYILKYVV